MSQTQHSEDNKKAWSHRAYEAWNRLHGPPAKAAKKICDNPEYVLRHTLPYHPDLRGKKVANLLGSYGRRAIALAVLGAEVTVVDISEDNRRYAVEMAQAAKIDINYIVADLITWDSTGYVDYFDFVVMELGILHYFVDLAPLFALIQRILAPGGHYVLHEFHPFSRKGNPEKDGDRVYLCGDYFDQQVVMTRPAPYSFAFSEKEVADFPLCPNRYWTLGEIITSVIASGMTLKHLTEQPHGEITTMPSTFILVAQK